MPRLRHSSICLQVSLHMPPVRPRSNRCIQSIRMMTLTMDPMGTHRPLYRCRINLPPCQCSSSPAVQSAAPPITSTAQPQLYAMTTINRAPIQILPTSRHSHPRRMIGRRQLLPNRPHSICQHTRRQPWTPGTWKTRTWFTSRPITAMLICRTTHRPTLHPSSDPHRSFLRPRMVHTCQH